MIRIDRTVENLFSTLAAPSRAIAVYQYLPDDNRFECVETNTRFDDFVRSVSARPGDDPANHLTCDDGTRLASRFLRLMDDGETFFCAAHMTAPDGTRLQTKVTAFKMPGERIGAVFAPYEVELEPDSERPPGTLDQHELEQHIRDKMRENSILKRIEKNLATAQRLAQIGSWDWDIVAGTLYWTDEIYRIFGLMPQEFGATYEAFLTYVHPDDRELVTGAVNASLENPDVRYDVVHRVVRNDGQVRKVREVGEVIFDDTGTPVMMVGTVQDITDAVAVEEALKKALFEVQEASRAKSEFLANMSHELRTPLNAIIGFSDVMVAGLFGGLEGTPYGQYAKDINTSGRQLLALINEILDVSRLEAENFEIRETEIDFNAAIKACHILIEDRAKRKDITIDYALDPDLPYLMADVVQLKQIVLNLVSNAIKYSPKGRQVRVTTSQAADGGLQLVIADNGVGIRPADIPKVLSRFGQVAQSYARGQDDEGAGLGLYIVQLLCKLHGADFRLESEFGVGTTVKVTFPPGRSAAA